MVTSDSQERTGAFRCETPSDTRRESTTMGFQCEETEKEGAFDYTFPDLSLQEGLRPTQVSK